MIDRGKQFEFAVMKSAYSRIRNPSLTKQSMLTYFNGQPIEAMCKMQQIKRWIG